MNSTYAFQWEKGSYETSYMLTLNISVLFCLASPTFKMQLWHNYIILVKVNLNKTFATWRFKRC